MSILPPVHVAPSFNATSSDSETSHHYRRVLWSLHAMTAANGLGIFFVYLMIHILSESNWLGVALTFFPRMFYPLPGCVLAIASWRWSRNLAMSNVLLMLIALGPIMEFRWGGLFAASDPKGSIKILSCNVQGYVPDFEDLLQEIESLDPDIVAFQESRYDFPRQVEYFSRSSWHYAGFGEFNVYSRFPIRELPNAGIFTGYSRWPMNIVAGFEIETDRGTFRLFNIHQSTPRHELAELSLRTIWNGEAASKIEQKSCYRENESALMRDHIENLRDDGPFVVIGDFNTPSSSSLLRSHWGDLQNAFDQIGFGYGYTANCGTKKYWPTGLPWARIDHILGSLDCRFERCITGSSNGSDHRLIMTWMTLPNP